MITWTADSCTGNTNTGCKIVIDTTNPNNPTFVSFERRCINHSTISGDTLLQTMLSESRRKEYTRQKLLEIASSILGTTNTDGVLVWKNGVSMNWSYDSNRILTISVSGVTLTTQQKATAQSWCDTQFGSGKVIVV